MSLSTLTSPRSFDTLDDLIETLSSLERGHILDDGCVVLRARLKDTDDDWERVLVGMDGVWIDSPEHPGFIHGSDLSAWTFDRCY